MKRACCTIFLLLYSCMLGPNYHRPVSPMPVTYVEDPQAEIFLCADEDLENWWDHFQDPCLTQWIQEAFRANFDLLIALERMAQSRAQYWIQFTDILPNIQADASAARSRTSQSLTSIVPVKFQNFFLTSFSTLWEIDVFGGLRRAARAAYYTWEASAEEARNVRIIVAAEVATTYVAITTLQQQREIANHILSLDQELVRLASDRLQAGLGDEKEFANYLAQLELDKTRLSQLNISLKQAIYSLGTLLGKIPESLMEQFQTVHTVPNALGKIPVGLPSDLLRRRPDIRAAERHLAAATEQIGVAVAALFPTFSLTGSSNSFSVNPLQGANYGYASNSLSKLFKSISRIWGIGILADWNLFNFGANLANVDVQRFVKNQAFLTYEKAVVSALQEVEGYLVGYFEESARAEDFFRRVTAVGRVLELTGDQFQAGLVNYDEVLLKKQLWLEAQNDFLASQQATASNLIALYKALGGGWSCSTMQ